MDLRYNKENIFGGTALMFKDAKEELKRIESELLAEEALDQENTPQEEPADDELLDDATLNALLEETQTIGDAATYINYSNQYITAQDDKTRVFQIYNTDKSDPKLDDYADAVLEEPRSGKFTGLIVTAAILSAGIVGILVWWVFHYWGSF